MVRVYPDQEKVDVINSGTPVTLSMKDNGFVTPAAAPVGGKNPAVVSRQNPTEDKVTSAYMRAHPALSEEEVIRLQENGGEKMPAMQ